MLTIKNEMLGRGMPKALNEFINTEFPEGMGDICWQLALAFEEVEKHAKAYDKIMQKLNKSFNDVRLPIMKDYMDESGKKFKSPEDQEAFKNHPKITEAVEVIEKAIKELNAQEATYDFNRITITRDQLNKMKVKPIVLNLLIPILDIK